MLKVSICGHTVTGSIADPQALSDRPYEAHASQYVGEGEGDADGLVPNFELPCHAVRHLRKVAFCPRIAARSIHLAPDGSDKGNHTRTSNCTSAAAALVR